MNDAVQASKISMFTYGMTSKLSASQGIKPNIRNNNNSMKGNSI